MKLEDIAIEEYKNVPDDGLFPNYTDKDIWVAGFVAGLKYFKNAQIRNLELKMNFDIDLHFKERLVNSHYGKNS